MTPSARARGFTLLELVLVCAVLVILAGLSYPVVKYTQLRLKEMELRADLREMRSAIDEYKRYSDAGLIEVEFGTDGYPPKLETLVEGVPVVGQVDKTVKFLRRIPIDPMTNQPDWGLRSYQDDYDATSWGGEDIYDVYSLASGKGLNGVPYSQW